MSLYRKYRPQNFANLVGQDHIKTTLQNAVARDSVAHAYLFCGPRGTGKTSTARLLAKALNCLNRGGDGEPCDECDMCETLGRGNLIDVIEIDAASNRGIDEIRDLREKIGYAPTRAKNKIYIIDEVHMLTKEAFNALLKTLEEPPAAVYFILATTEVHKVPETVISRCQRFDFKRIDEKTLMTRLNYIAQKEKIEVDEAAVALVARHVQGGLRDAIGLLEQMTMHGKLDYDYVRAHLGVAGHQTVTALLAALREGKLKQALHLINEVHAEGYDLESFVREILEALREALMEAVSHNAAETDEILRMVDAFQRARDMLRSTTIPQLPLEIAAIQMCHADQAIAPPATRETTETEQKTVRKIKTTFAKEEQKAEKEHEEMKTVAAAAQKDAASDQTEKLPFTISYLKEHWPRILEKTKPPALRRSLGDGTVAKVEKGTVLLRFRSEFHLEKVNHAEHKAAIEAILNELFDLQKAKIECELEKVCLEPDGETVDPKERARHAMEIFGGELEA